MGGIYDSPVECMHAVMKNRDCDQGKLASKHASRDKKEA